MSYRGGKVGARSVLTVTWSGVTLMRALALFLVLALTPTSSRADFYDGNKWKAVCDSPSPDQQMLCLGIIAGVVDGFGIGFRNGSAAALTKARAAELTKSEKQYGASDLLAYSVKNAPTDLFCLPDGAVLSQVKDAVYRYVDKQVAQRQLPLAVLAGIALGETWPCSDK